MLKITYLEEEIFLEHLEESIEIWKADRILVSFRAGVSTYVESSIASLILPINVHCLKGLIKLSEQELIDVFPCDEEFIEVSLSGTWIAQSQDSESGIFACELGQENEDFLYQLWLESRVKTSVISE